MNWEMKRRVCAWFVAWEHVWGWECGNVCGGGETGEGREDEVWSVDGVEQEDRR